MERWDKLKTLLIHNHKIISFAEKTSSTGYEKSYYNGRKQELRNIEKAMEEIEKQS